MDHDRRLRDEGLENEPALGGANLLWGYDDVRDEPGLVESGADSGNPHDALGDEPALADTVGLDTYGSLYRRRRAEVPATGKGLTLGLIATAMVPLPIVGIFILQAGGTPFFRAIAATVLLPVVLEVLKPAAALAVIEGRPWLISDRASLVGAHVVGGLGFGVVLYGLIALGPLLVGVSYSPIRLGVAMALHSLTALISGLGVAKVWAVTDEQGTPPVLRAAVPYVLAAVAVHAAYGIFVLTVADSSWAF